MNFYEDTIYNLLNEDIEAVKKYYPNIDDNTFMDLIALDPTYKGKNSLGKYGKWILNLFNKGEIEENDFDDVTKILNQFTTYRNRIQNKDLNAYKTLNDLSDTLAQVVDDDSMLSDRQKLRFKKNVKAGKVFTSAEDDYDVVFEDNQYIVYVPNTHEASMKLGKGTHWCTAHENPEWYDKYTKDGGKLYIFKNKDNGYRYQYSDSTGDFLNELDKDFDIREELSSADKKLAKFIYKLLNIDLNDDTLVYNGGKLNSSIIDKNNIKKIIISDDVSVISTEAFYGFTNLTTIEIPNSVEKIEDSAFLSCKSLHSITLPNSIKYIGDYAFAGCTNLVSIDMSNVSITETGDELFLDCYSLTDIKFPTKLKEISFGSFNHCRSLTNLTIPNSVESIHDYALQDCPSLSSLIILNDNANMSDYVFGKDRYDFRTDTEYIVSESIQKLTIYTDSSSILEYAKTLGIKTQPLSKVKTESLKLRIKEDTACIASKTSFIEDGYDKNGIYYFGEKPILPMNWRDNFKIKKQNKLKESVNMKLIYEEENMIHQFFEVESKQVKDSDGWQTDYTMYMEVVCPTSDWFNFLKSDRAKKGDIPEEWINRYVFVFGDNDVYGPEDGDFDYECETEEEAYEWFNNYNGFDDEDDEYY